MRVVVLEDILVDSRSGFASGKHDENGIVQVRMNNIATDCRLVWDNIRRVPPPKKVEDLLLEKGDILFNATNSPELVGKSALFSDYPESVTFSNHFVRLRLRQDLAHPSYVSRLLQDRWEQRAFLAICKQWVNQASVSKEDLFSLKIPLPTIDEQMRIAAILDQADSLRRMRQHTIDRLNTLGQAIFREMFGDPVNNSMGWNDEQTLGGVADIVSGITKGRKLNGQRTRMIPYLAVANVQERALRLSGVKVIEATEDEIQRYRLRINDLLLTEGGDPDKLGRGTLWNGEIPECIHQNHVFRVRLTCNTIEPVFLNWLIGSERGKKYFLRSAKQTTGIASINMTQLRGFPLLIPPLDLQRDFCRRLALIEKQKATYKAALDSTEAMFASLQHRAFRGEL